MKVSCYFLLVACNKIEQFSAIFRDDPFDKLTELLSIEVKTVVEVSLAQEVMYQLKLFFILSVFYHI